MLTMYIIAILAIVFYFYADPQTQERLARKEMEREEKEERNQFEHQTGSFSLYKIVNFLKRRDLYVYAYKKR